RGRGWRLPQRRVRFRLVVEPRPRRRLANQSVMKQLPRLGIVALSLMLLGAACDGKNSSPRTLNRPSPSPQSYVSVVCNALLEWKNSIEVAASSLVTEAPSLEGATAYLNYVLGVTDRMLAHVQAVGVPTAPNGGSVQSDVIRGLVSARSALLRVQARVASLVAQGPLDVVKEAELPILLAVEALKSELRKPTSIEMVQATVADTDCTRLFRRKPPLGKGA